MNTRPSFTRVLPWAALAVEAALILLLAQRYRELSRAYTDLRRHTRFLQPGDVVPTFTGTTLDGAKVTIGTTASLDTRQMLFVFRTTCPYCVATLPIWERIADSLRRVSTPRIDVFAVSLDSALPTRVYARVHHLEYPVVEFPERKLAHLYRVAATPQTLVLNSEGRVLYARTGLLDNPAVIDSVYRAATLGSARKALPLAAGGAGASREQQ